MTVNNVGRRSNNRCMFILSAFHCLLLQDTSSKTASKETAIDLGNGNELLVDISDALSERDKVLLTKLDLSIIIHFRLSSQCTRAHH
jgi:hypothetical protein